MSLVKRSPLSLKELEARRANAGRSTGPRTALCKARVCLNRLQHGGRSAWLQVFLRQRGIHPRSFFDLCESNRLPGQRVDPIQATIVELWLKSPARGGPLSGAQGREAGPGGHLQAQEQATVESLLSTKKRASGKRALSSDYKQIPIATILESALPTPSERGAGRIGGRQINSAALGPEAAKASKVAETQMLGEEGEGKGPGRKENIRS